MVGELCCPGRAPMRDRHLVPPLHAAMRPTKIVQSHAEPTHPAVRPRGLGKGQRLTPLALLAQAPGPHRPLHPARLHDWVASEIPARRQPRCAMHAPHVAPLEPPPWRRLLPLPIGEAWWPAAARTTGPPWAPGGRDPRAPSTGCTAGPRRAVRGLGADRWEMPRPPPLFGGVSQGPGLLGGPFAAAERHDPLAIRGARPLGPQSARPRQRVGWATLRLFFTQLPGASHATARGGPSRPRWSWNRAAWRPALRRRRATVSWAPLRKRAVARPPPPSPRGASRATAFASVPCVLPNAVPRRAEHSAPQRRPRRRRMASWP